VLPLHVIAQGLNRTSLGPLSTFPGLGTSCRRLPALPTLSSQTIHHFVAGLCVTLLRTMSTRVVAPKPEALTFI
jgi:hypothetical protein